jgi:NAD(P)-dependent dehydrogenase (short-subunit alcohol dehydrogenase family)
MPTAIVIGIGSDIGRELALRFARDGWSVSGTFHSSTALTALPAGVRLVSCDLTSTASILTATQSLSDDAAPWDLLVVAAGTEEPIGTFWECDPSAWDENIRINALSPLRLVRGLYPLRNQVGTASVAFFSGAGTNSAAPNYSAYCASKILLMKMCELLDAESPDTSFFIIGPGIVRTKIHEETLRAPQRSGANYRKVVDFLSSADPGTSHDDIYVCLRWCMNAGKPALGGRNISLVHDSWRGGGVSLLQQLRQNPELYKLRRFGNEMIVPTGEI